MRLNPDGGLFASPANIHGHISNLYSQEPDHPLAGNLHHAGVLAAPDASAGRSPAVAAAGSWLTWVRVERGSTDFAQLRSVRTRPCRRGGCWART